MLLGDVCVFGCTTFEILDLAESHRNCFANQKRCIISGRPALSPQCFPTLTLPLQFSLNTLAVISVHDMLGCG